MELKKLRKEFCLYQVKAANIIDIPIRTYTRYEKDGNYDSSLKREAMIKSLKDACEVTNVKGLLSLEQISNSINELIKSMYKNDIYFYYIFGSYAKGYAKEKSDIDICVSTKLVSLNFVKLKSDLETKLHKNVDLIRFSDLNNNLELNNEIMKDGIKIYG